MFFFNTVNKLSTIHFLTFAKFTNGFCHIVRLVKNSFLRFSYYWNTCFPSLQRRFSVFLVFSDQQDPNQWHFDHMNINHQLLKKLLKEMAWNNHNRQQNRLIQTFSFSYFSLSTLYNFARTKFGNNKKDMFHRQELKKFELEKA